MKIWMLICNINSKNIKLKNIGFELKMKSTIEPSILIIQTHSQQFVIRSSTCYLSGELVPIEFRAPRPQSQPLYPNGPILYDHPIYCYIKLKAALQYLSL